MDITAETLRLLPLTEELEAKQLHRQTGLTGADQSSHGFCLLKGRASKNLFPNRRPDVGVILILPGQGRLTVLP